MVKQVRVDLDQAMTKIQEKKGVRPTLKEIQDMLGLKGSQTLHNWRAGKNMQTISQLKKLSKESGMSLDSLIIYIHEDGRK
jgi:DNA-directed RNA polymerase specialized sigma subunit